MKKKSLNFIVFRKETPKKVFFPRKKIQWFVIYQKKETPTGGGAPLKEFFKFLISKVGAWEKKYKLKRPWKLKFNGPPKFEKPWGPSSQINGFFFFKSQNKKQKKEKKFGLLLFLSFPTNPFPKIKCFALFKFHVWNGVGGETLHPHKKFQKNHPGKISSLGFPPRNLKMEKLGKKGF